MPTNLTSNVKIGNKGPYWLNVPYFEPTADGVSWTCTTDIDLGTIGTQIIIKAPKDFTDGIRLTFGNDDNIPIICNKGGLSAGSYLKGSYLQLVYDGTNWVILN